MSDSFAKDSDFPVGEGFGYSSMGVMPNGANGLGVWLKGSVRVRLSNTLNEDMTGQLNGVGVVESQLSSDDLTQAKDIHRRLCEAVRRQPSTELEPMRPPLVYSVTCMESGQLKPYQGQWHELPRELAYQLSDYQYRIMKNYAGRGRAILKLDVVVADVQREQNKLAISVRFVNSGRYPLIMSTPDHWSRQGHDRLRVGGKSAGNAARWGVDLTGAPLVNKNEFTEDDITVAGGTSVLFRFLAVPDEKIERGTYNVNALVVTEISGDPSLGRVGFTSDNSKPAVVTFDRDYPSTLEELEHYEAQKREQMSSRPVYPLSTFAENGYYRAVSDRNQQRSRFLTRFHKGEVAPEVEAVIDEQGNPIYGGLPAWIWEADLGLAPHGTSTVCYEGESCPRSGRWFARQELPHQMFPPAYDDSANWVISCKAGQVMPGSVHSSRCSQVRWEWIGI
jgi:hypothetical protein